VGHGHLRPEPLFKTPGNAAYCSLTSVSLEDYGPRLFCWTPNDGWGIDIAWKERRARPDDYSGPPHFVHDYGFLKNWKPQALLLPFGDTWILRCARISDGATCSSGRQIGRIAFRCWSKSTGLTCTNAVGHGFWIGRYRGYRLL
jgi:hypothetical protein